MDTFSHPFRFVNGNVSKVDDRSDAFSAQIIAAVIKTATGEMLLTPDFGTRQSEFSSLDRSGLAYSIASYHPLVSIDSISEVIDPSGSNVAARIEFSTNRPIGS